MVLRCSSVTSTQSRRRRRDFTGMPRPESGWVTDGVPIALVGAKRAGRYRILVSHEGPLPLDVVSILDAVAAQLVVAVERVDLAADSPSAPGRSPFPIADPKRLRRDRGGAARPALDGGDTFDRSGARLQPRRRRDARHRHASSTPTTPAKLWPSSRTCWPAVGRVPIRTEWRLRHADGRWIPMEVIANDLSRDPDVNGVVLTLPRRLGPQTVGGGAAAPRLPRQPHRPAQSCLVQRSRRSGSESHATAGDVGLASC